MPPAERRSPREPKDAAIPCLLFVEDEINLQRSLAYILESEGFSVEAVRSGEEGVAAARSRRPDIVLLDLVLPGMDGYDVCRALRRDPRTAKVPVVILSGKGLADDVVRGLTGFAEDYVVKPCDPKVLLARLRAVLRREGRGPEKPEAPLSFGTLTIDPLSRETRLGGKAVPLTRTEFDILSLLAGAPNRVFSRGRIIDRVRGEDYAITERTVDFQVCRLRRKLGAESGRIESVRGLGYKFVA